MLLLVSRQVLVLLMSTTVIMKGAFAEPNLMETTIEPCLNNEEFRFMQDEKKTCDWIGEKEARKEKLCWKPNVKNNCPKTCNVHCNLEECPLKEPNGDSSCLEYIDGLSCEYTKASYTCINSKWNGTIHGKPVEEGECPDQKPANGDTCSEPMGCGYETIEIDCSGVVDCKPTQRFDCNGENWVEVEGFYDLSCEDGSTPIFGEQHCKRTSC